MEAGIAEWLKGWRSVGGLEGCVWGVEECGGKSKCVEGGVEVSLGGCCVGGSGGQVRLGAFPQLLDTMLPDVCSKHVPASVVKVYMSCRQA